MGSEEPATTYTNDEETTCCFEKICPKLKRKQDDETTPILSGKEQPSYKEKTGSNETVNNGETSNPDSTDAPSKVEKNASRPKKVKCEEIKMTLLGISKVDAIFKAFQETFNSFTNCQKSMVEAVEEFKIATKTTGEFIECLKQFKRQHADKAVKMKKLAMKFPNAVLKSADSVGSAATALTKILEAYGKMENLPVKVADSSIKCVKYMMELDPAEVAGEEFSGSVFDLGRISQQMTNVHENLKQGKKALGIVKAFFQYSTSIVIDIVEVFGDEKSRKEVDNTQGRVNDHMNETDAEMNRLVNPEPPKEIKFTALGIPTLDELFNDISKIVNPVAKTSKDLYDARGRLEEAMKAISEFRDDKTKAFNEYLDELKRRVKKGDIHIVVTVKGNRIEIEKVEGWEPNVMKNIESGLKGVVKSGNEIEDLGPDTITELIKLAEDIFKISPSDIRSHVSLKELPSKVFALKENSLKAKKIPGILKFFLCFVRNLLMDILDVLHADTPKESAPNEKTSPETKGSDSSVKQDDQTSSNNAN